MSHEMYEEEGKGYCKMEMQYSSIHIKEVLERLENSARRMYDSPMMSSYRDGYICAIRDIEDLFSDDNWKVEP